MKIADLWVVAPCSLEEVTDVLEIVIACIIKEVVIEATITSKTSVTSTRLHGVVIQKTSHHDNLGSQIFTLLVPDVQSPKSV
jgi:hypothetical protein